MKNIGGEIKDHKIVFLIPIFESIECVEDLICNIQNICPNSFILFHVNLNSDESFFSNVELLTQRYDDCSIFPKRYPSNWGDGYLATVYIEMMDWCLSNLNFEYVYLTASNSLMINPLLVENINQFDLYFYEPGIKSSGDWWEHISKDEKLFEYMEGKVSNVYCAIIEGMAISKQYTEWFVKELKPFLNHKPVFYPTEEYWIATAYVYLKAKNKMNHHPFNLERWAHMSDATINQYKLKVEKTENYVGYLIKEKQYEVLANMNIYSLKKINRQYNDPLRDMIRNHFSYINKVF